MGEKNIHCPMIHGGLSIDLKNESSLVHIKPCCLLPSGYKSVGGTDLWNDNSLIPLRELNNKNEWHPGCWTCQGNEASGLTSFRTGMLEKFGYRTQLSGPQRLDLMFDISCNLACRTCGPYLSTFWQKHLKENKITFSTTSPISKADEMIAILKTLDLSNLEMVVFSGGETLMGNGYWRVADAIANMVPHAKEKLIISFQTNGTQLINEKYFSIIEKFHLVKLNISLDGIGKRFEYLRWPANWDQVTNNIFNLRESLPVNVMFLIEETLSIFNLHYQSELDCWIKNNFSVNRLGDSVTHTQHTATGIYSLSNLSQQYVDSLKDPLKNLINPNWQEHPLKIQAMIAEIAKFDNIRNEDWKKTFPEVASFYSEYL